MLNIIWNPLITKTNVAPVTNVKVAILRLDDYISNKTMVRNTNQMHGKDDYELAERPKYRSAKKDGRGRAGSKGKHYLVES